MSTTDDGTGSTTDRLEGPRVCPDDSCQGFGIWRGDRSRGELVVHCTTDDCARSWTAPDRSDEVSD